MKTNLFLIFKYWKENQLQFVKMIASIVILVVLMVVSVLMERTECRRAFDNMLYGKGRASYSFADLSDEIYSEMQTDKLVEAIGRTAICGKLGNEYQQYTYGTYMDVSSEKLEYLKLTVGRFPTASGEVALYDYILEDMFFVTDMTSCIGKEITLSQFDFGEGNKTGKYKGEITLKIVGVICTDELREQKEYTAGWGGHGNFMIKSMPVIYLYVDDCCITKETSTYTLVKLYNDDVLTKEQEEISFKDFLVKYNDKYKITPSGREGIKSAASYVANFRTGSEEVQTQIYQSDMMTVIKYFSVIVIVVSAISLFGILFSIMPERMKSLSIVRKIGCSRKRVIVIILMEWFLLLILGSAIGCIVGVVLYEFVLWLQDYFLQLTLLRGYTAEWAVLQVTDNPFVSAIVCATWMFAIGYVIYFLCFLYKERKQRKRKKVRTLHCIMMKLSGNKIANFMQIMSLALILFATIMCYSYYTMNGKGSGYFTNSELNGDSYYNYANVNLRNSKTDICIYESGGGGTFGLAVIEDNGLPADTVCKISEISGVKSVQGYVTNMAFNLFYPKESKEVPNQIAQFYAELSKDADEMLYPDERNYYNIPAVFANDIAIEKLSKYVIDGEIGTFENGMTMVFYEVDGISTYPYKVGDTINSIALDGSMEHQGHDMEIVVEAIAVIPEVAKENDSITYANFNFDKGITFAAPQETANFLNTYKENYNNVYVTLHNTTSIDEVTQKIQSLLDSSMKVKIQTISACDDAYRKSYIERFSTVIVLFVILIFMAIIGYYSMISMRLQIAKPKIAVLRTIGLSLSRWNGIFLLQNILNTFWSCIIGTGMVYIMRYFINRKYLEALECFGYPERDLFGASSEVYQHVNELNNVYLFEYEIHNASVVFQLIVVSLILVVLSVMVSGVLLHRSKNESIVSQLNIQKGE